jgi:TRAP-type C4-dicarboxylate transport system substrate-binding protein
VKLLIALVLLAGVARAQTGPPLRFAAVTPDGTPWARVLRGFSYDVSSGTNDELQIKWIWGGIAGDELAVVDRIRRGQLDGSASSAGCERLAPSMRVTRLIGLLQNRDELKMILGKMRPRIDAEMAQQGFVELGFVANGMSILMTRQPVSSMDDLRKTRVWVWNEDDVMLRALETLGVPVVSAGLNEAAQLYSDGKVDGFVTIPLGALAFQWSAQARYFTELPIGFLPGCLIASQRRIDGLSVEQKAVVRSAGARVALRFDDAGATQDAQLLGGLFDRQGMKRVTVSPTFRAQFFEEATAAREKIAPGVVPKELLAEVLGWLADWRAEHAR